MTTPKGKLNKVSEFPVRGKKGEAGTKGADGSQGAIGPSGLQGTQGTSGQQGVPGKPGMQGDKGIQGQQGNSGLKGSPGEQGEQGLSPAHRWHGNKIQFQNPDGSWGKETDLTGPQGSGGGATVTMTGGSTGASPIKYTPVTTASYVVPKGLLIEGINMFGVRYDAGPVTIELPPNLSPTYHIVVNDETGNTSVNNITVTVRN